MCSEICWDLSDIFGRAILNGRLFILDYGYHLSLNPETFSVNNIRIHIFFIVCNTHKNVTTEAKQWIWNYWYLKNHAKRPKLRYIKIVTDRFNKIKSQYQILHMMEITFVVVTVTVAIKWWPEYTVQFDDHKTQKFSNMLMELQRSEDTGKTWQHPVGNRVILCHNDFVYWQLLDETWNKVSNLWLPLDLSVSFGFVMRKVLLSFNMKFNIKFISQSVKYLINVS